MAGMLGCHIRQLQQAVAKLLADGVIVKQRASPAPATPAATASPKPWSTRSTRRNAGSVRCRRNRAASLTAGGNRPRGGGDKLPGRGEPAGGQSDLEQRDCVTNSCDPRPLSGGRPSPGSPAARWCRFAAATRRCKRPRHSEPGSPPGEPRYKMLQLDGGGHSPHAHRRSTS